MFTRPRKFLLETALNWALILFLVVIMEVACCALSHAAEPNESPVAVNMEIIADIESGSEPSMFNKNTGAVGEYQIRPGVVADYNRYMKNEGWTKLEIDDMYNLENAKNVSQWYMNVKIPEYLKNYGIPDTISSRIIAWNWGIGHLRKWFRGGSHWFALPMETRGYLKKYFKELKEGQAND